MSYETQAETPEPTTSHTTDSVRTNWLTEFCQEVIQTFTWSGARDIGVDPDEALKQITQTQTDLQQNANPSGLPPLDKILDTLGHLLIQTLKRIFVLECRYVDFVEQTQDTWLTIARQLGLNPESIRSD